MSIVIITIIGTVLAIVALCNILLMLRVLFLLMEVKPTFDYLNREMLPNVAHTLNDTIAVLNHKQVKLGLKKDDEDA